MNQRPVLQFVFSFTAQSTLVVQVLGETPSANDIRFMEQIMDLITKQVQGIVAKNANG